MPTARPTTSSIPSAATSCMNSEVMPALALPVELALARPVAAQPDLHVAGGIDDALLDEPVHRRPVRALDAEDRRRRCRCGRRSGRARAGRAGRRRRGCRARRSSGRRRGSPGSRRRRAPRRRSRSIAAWLASGSAGKHRRRRRSRRPAAPRRRRCRRSGGVPAGSRRRGSRAARSACRGGRRRGRRSAAPTIATSTPTSSAGSSVYGCPAKVSRPVKSGFSPCAAQRASGSIIASGRYQRRPRRTNLSRHATAASAALRPRRDQGARARPGPPVRAARAARHATSRRPSTGSCSPSARGLDWWAAGRRRDAGRARRPRRLPVLGRRLGRGRGGAAAGLPRRRAARRARVRRGAERRCARPISTPRRRRTLRRRRSGAAPRPAAPSALPRSVRRYSTPGGLSGITMRSIRPARSRSRRREESIRGEIPTTAAPNSLKRTAPECAATTTWSSQRRSRRSAATRTSRATGSQLRQRDIAHRLERELEHLADRHHRVEAHGLAHLLGDARRGRRGCAPGSRRRSARRRGPRAPSA